MMTFHVERFVAALCYLVALACPVLASDGPTITKLGESMVDARGLTIHGAYGDSINGQSFQQDAVISHAGYQYVGYYDSDRRVCLARRKLPSDSWEVIRFQDYHFAGDDAHNIISVGICPQDGTIHLAFDHHCSPLHYRMSRAGVANTPAQVTWDAGLFGSVHADLEPGKGLKTVTYPCFLQTPTGGLQLFWRIGGSGHGDEWMSDYDPGKGVWKNTHQIDSGYGSFTDGGKTTKARSSYQNGFTYGPDGKLHVTWTWREESQTGNHDILYRVSPDGGKTWQTGSGATIDTPANVATPGILVVPVASSQGLMNSQAQAVDSKGCIHAVMWHCTPESLTAAEQADTNNAGRPLWGYPQARRYHHYWRSDDGTWKHHEMPWVSGNRPKLFFDRKDNAYIIYGYAIPPGTNGIYFDKGQLLIAGASAASGWTDWHLLYTDQGPYLNEMLADPIRIKNDNILSIMVQKSPAKSKEPTELKILDFAVGK